MKPKIDEYTVHLNKTNRINHSNCSLWNNLDNLITQFTGKKRATVTNTPGEVLQPWRSSIKYLASGEQVPLLVKYWHYSQGQREKERNRDVICIHVRLQHSKKKNQRSTKGVSLWPLKVASLKRWHIVIVVLLPVAKGTGQFSGSILSLLFNY